MPSLAQIAKKAKMKESEKEGVKALGYSGVGMAGGLSGVGLSAAASSRRIDADFDRSMSRLARSTYRGWKRNQQLSEDRAMNWASRAAEVPPGSSRAYANFAAEDAWRRAQANRGKARSSLRRAAQNRLSGMKNARRAKLYGRGSWAALGVGAAGLAGATYHSSRAQKAAEAERRRKATVRRLAQRWSGSSDAVGKAMGRLQPVTAAGASPAGTATRTRRRTMTNTAAAAGAGRGTPGHNMMTMAKAVEPDVDPGGFVASRSDDAMLRDSSGRFAGRKVDVGSAVVATPYAEEDTG
jgi:hypothetical protein